MNYSQSSGMRQVRDCYFLSFELSVLALRKADRKSCQACASPGTRDRRPLGVTRSDKI